MARIILYIPKLLGNKLCPNDTINLPQDPPVRSTLPITTPLTCPVSVSELQSSDSTSLAMKFCLLAVALAYVSQQAEASKDCCIYRSLSNINQLPILPLFI